MYVCICKINSTKTFVNHALMLCSQSKLVNELEFIKKTLLKNGYPIKYKCLQFFTKTKFGPESSPVYLRLSWISKAFMQQIEQIKRSINCHFNLVKFILKSNLLFSPNLNDNVTTLQKSSLIY